MFVDRNFVNLLPEAIRKKQPEFFYQLELLKGNNNNIVLHVECKNLDTRVQTVLIRWFSQNSYERAIKFCWALILSCKCAEDLEKFSRGGRFEKMVNVVKPLA